MAAYLISGATIINEGAQFIGNVLVENGRISKVSKNRIEANDATTINAEGLLLLPGVIDDQVHFREPGLTHKGDIASESRAAVAGGITSFMEMPNTKPATTTIELLEEKFEIAAKTSYANYSFYIGATNENLDVISKIDPKSTCGVKVFMGSSTGNMLVDERKTLEGIFAESPTIVTTHCEEEATIRRNLAEFQARYGEAIPVEAHPLIRSNEACVRSTDLAISLASKYGSRLHVLHLSTREEMALFDTKPLAEKKITGEVCVHHLWFSDKDYAQRGNFIKWNPAVKSEADRDALRDALKAGKLDVVATDHAPHTFEEKSNPYLTAPSGGPSVQHSLTLMLELAKQGFYTIEEVVNKMCHAPATLFQVAERGFIREGHFADLVLVDPSNSWTISKENILYKCGWSPFDGVTLSNRIKTTFVNGEIAYSDGVVCDKQLGMRLTFDR
ncbi:dihydroorotase [Acetobacteroides hydrogenigenes]|uniref:Dihydroorotase n=1 Tax=Acetobacteroides hydrogenigenes TaxID=979970 RepID=A0A4R2E2I4_9BACT|nr:dihydroorotase [Acetobacteroides hydrogenigenes]TCN61375.1 dihydroorotase [Acetobacteroides hydrogenigenes]